LKTIEEQLKLLNGQPLISDEQRAAMGQEVPASYGNALVGQEDMQKLQRYAGRLSLDVKDVLAESLARIFGKGNENMRIQILMPSNIHLTSPDGISGDVPVHAEVLGEPTAPGSYDSSGGGSDYDY